MKHEWERAWSPESCANETDLNYFIALQEARPMDSPEHSAKKWDQRAEFWKKERGGHRKGDGRVQSAVDFLDQRGLLKPEYDLVDIGCGPGRFAAAFAKRVRSVVGLDLSEKMVAHGMEHIREEGLENARLQVCDFQTLDVEKAGYRGAFDLVFSSMTPAIHGMNGLLKSMEMSRAYCCNITRLSGRDHLKEQIMTDLFGKEPAPSWLSRWFYALFNVLFLMGYYPETSYETRHQEVKVQPDEGYADSIMEHILPPQACTKENAAKILSWLNAHTEEDGTLTEVSDSCYGRILWDVRTRTQRPDYRSMK